MHLSTDLQTHLLDYLSDRQLYEMAGPSGVGVDAFNRLYRHVVVVDYENGDQSELAVGSADYSAKTAHRIYGARRFVEFCQRHPYYQPHIVEFPKQADYLEVLRSAPHLVQAAAGIWLDLGIYRVPGKGLASHELLANIRHYSCLSTMKFEEFAKMVQQQLPQLEELSFWFKLVGSARGVVHRCDFDHPSLRRLNFTSSDVGFDVVRFPDSLHELKMLAPRVRFTEQFDFDQSELTTLIGSPFKFPDGRSFASLPRFRAVELYEFGDRGDLTDMLGSPSLRSLLLYPFSHHQYSKKRLSQALTKLDLKFMYYSHEGAVSFELEFPEIRDLAVGYHDYTPMSDISLVGELPASLERLNLRYCVLEPMHGLAGLENLTYLRLVRCSLAWLELPPNLVECELQYNALRTLELPPGLKKLTLVDDNCDCDVQYNAALESLSLTVKAGGQYHDFPNLKELSLKSPKNGRFIACAATLSLPSSLKSLELQSVDASRLELPSSLIDLSMPACDLTKLPVLPHLESLDVSDNQMVLSGSLPPSLRALNVIGNKFPARLDWSTSNLRVLLAGERNANIALPASVEIVWSPSENQPMAFEGLESLLDAFNMTMRRM